MTCLGAARGTSAATGLNTRDVRDFDIAFITDVHIERGKIAVSKFSKTIAEINSRKPAFVWDMGDMSLYPNSGNAYLDCARLFQMPLHACPGNHDIALNDTNPRKLFNDCFGPAYHSFDFGGVHFITLDGNTVVHRQGKDPGLDEIAKTIEEKEVTRIVVGLPFHMDGRPGDHHDDVLEFVALLEERFGLPVDTVDERMTTIMAERALAEAKLTRKKRKAKVDQVAAQLILQFWLDSREKGS